MAIDNLKEFIANHLRQKGIHDEFQYALEQIGHEDSPLAYEMMNKRILWLVKNLVIPTNQDEKMLKDWEAYLKEMDALPPNSHLILGMVNREILLKSCSLFVKDGLSFYHLQRYQKTSLKRCRNRMEIFFISRDERVEKWLEFPEVKELTDQISHHYALVMLTEEKMTFNEMGSYCFLAGYLTGLGWERFQEQS